MHVFDIERGAMVVVERTVDQLRVGGATGGATGGARGDTFVGPGWLDIQVNGFGGYDVNAAGLAAADFEAMTLRLHEVGVTRYLPTVVTASPEHMTTCLRAVGEACRSSRVVARAVAGIHLEGPFLSSDRGARGAHPAEHLRPADRTLFDDLQAAADGAIRVVTLAPETAGALDLIAHLAERGIVVALGHSLADGATIRAAVAAGARLSTHLGNGIPAELPRHPNPIWEQLADDRLTASAIFDGHHLPEAVMRVFARVKGPDRLVLISDAVALAGGPRGVYQDQVGGTVELHPSGRLTIHGTPYLAGSASSLRDGVATAIHQAGLPPEAALRMVGRTPRTLLGLGDDGDMTMVRVAGGGVEVLAVVVGGEVVVDRLPEA
jgi:N-acetylglucosamine-6-phosphate deacetylase